jgi:hypothetical protein
MIRAPFLLTCIRYKEDDVKNVSVLSIHPLFHHPNPLVELKKMGRPTKQTWHVYMTNTTCIIPIINSTNIWTCCSEVIACSSLVSCFLRNYIGSLLFFEKLVVTLRRFSRPALLDETHKEREIENEQESRDEEIRALQA